MGTRAARDGRAVEQAHGLIRKIAKRSSDRLPLHSKPTRAILAVVALRVVIKEVALPKIAGGDRRALEHLYLAHHRRLARFLSRFTQRHEMIEEIINDTFLVIWNQASRFRFASQVSTWIFCIAYRTALKSIRSQGIHFTPSRLEDDAQPFFDRSDGLEARDWVASGLSRIPVKQRLVLVLAYQALPGIPLIFAGIRLVAAGDDYRHLGRWWLIAIGAIGCLGVAADLLAAALGAKRVNASKRAIWGAVIGTVVGLFFGIVGVLVGPFFGAVVGELASGSSVTRSADVGLGTWIGLIFGMLVKLIASFMMVAMLLTAWFAGSMI
jgi:RNA polymerase sigma factor (sigma-70 family)